MKTLLAFAVFFLALPSDGAPVSDPGCTFDRGTTTCVIVDTSTTVTRITMTSGCMYGPEGRPGRRERVYDQTWLITATTTTYAHGRNGPVYDHTTTVTRTLQGMELVSDTCYPM